MDVYVGSATEETGIAIDKTQELHGLLEQRDMAVSELNNRYWNYDSPEYAQKFTEWKKLDQEYKDLHEDCPHGQLFWVGAESKDFSWNLVPRLTRTKNYRATLQHGEKVSLPFVYVVTESFFHHIFWHRFLLTVNSEQADSQRWEIIEPMMKIPENTAADESNASRFRVTKTLFRTVWKPRGTLIPLGPEPKEPAPLESPSDP